MKIAEIRDVIDHANWSRRDLTGGTSDEFRRQDVGRRLGEHLGKLKALVIPARFAQDIVNRASEINGCEAVIARWNDTQFRFEPREIDVVRIDPVPAFGEYSVFTYFCGRSVGADNAERFPSIEAARADAVRKYINAKIVVG